MKILTSNKNSNIYQRNNSMKTCSVLIPAYKADKWIWDCIKGFENQAPTKGYIYRIVVGVDGCQKTHDILKDFPHYYSKENMGAYVMLNSLIHYNPSDVYVFFGADDIPFPDFLSSVIPVAEEYGYTVVKQGHRDKTPKKKHGTAVFSQKVLDDVGGFQAYRCACDTDFRARVKFCGYKFEEALSKLPHPLFFRRRPSGSLTKNSATGMKSSYRRNVRKKMKQSYAAGNIKINPVIKELEYYETF